MTDWLDEVRAAAEAALPPLEGEIAAPGLASPVEVRRDRWDVAYLDAPSLHDLWFAQGFVTASERLFQMDLAIRAGTGRLSELFADITLAQDRFARVVGFHTIAAAEVERWSDASRAMLSRFVEGVHAWRLSMPAPPVEYALLGVEPELPSDPEAWLAPLAFAAWGLSGNWDAELLRAHIASELGSEAVATLLPPMPEPTAAAIAGGLAGRILDAIPRPRGQGSNAWVVAGSRTASGRPLLANDPHLLVQQPGAWFEVGLRASGYEARGVAFPFMPGIVVGVTPHHAWGITNVTGDVQDLYEERLNEAGTAAGFDGAWEPLAIRHEEIAVRGGETVSFAVRSTRHGPLLETEALGLAPVEYVPLGTTYSLRWTATDGLLEPAALVDVATADGFDAFREALRSISCPGQNVVYADVDGTTGFQLTGRYPRRRSGDGTVPVPGWTSEHEWDGWIAFEDLPWSRDPERGFVVTANHRAQAEDYPFLIGHDQHAPFRAERIAERLEPLEAATAEDMAAVQVDTVSIPARRLVPLMTRFEPRTDDERWALEVLGGWDGDLAASSTAAAVYDAWIDAIGRTLLGGHPEIAERYLSWRESFVCAALPRLLEDAGAPPGWAGVATVDELLRHGLASALAWLTAHLGEDRSGWRWGAMHGVRFAHPLARMPGLEALFVAAQHELGGDEQTILQAGFDGRSGFEAVVVPSYRVVVDLGDVDATLAVLPTGQSGHPASASWNDQAAMWIEGRLRSAPVTRAAVEAATQHVVTLTPR